MVCSNCNCEIKEGATYCLECGAPMDEPVVISSVKTKNVEKDANTEGSTKNKSKKGILQYEGKFFDFGEYVKALGSSPSILLGLIAALMVYVGPFLTWIWQKQHEIENSANLFDMGGSKVEVCYFALNDKTITLIAILIVLSSIDMLAFSACKYIGPLKGFETNYIVRGIPVIIVGVLLLIILGRDSYGLALENMEAQIELAEQFNKGSNYSGGKGSGPIILVVGMVLYAISVFLDYTKREK